MEEDINIVEIIFKTINSLCSSLFSSIDNSVYTLLDDLVFIDSEIIKDSFLEKIVGNASSRSNSIMQLSYLRIYNILCNFLTFILHKFFTHTTTLSIFIKINYIWNFNELFFFYL